MGMGIWEIALYILSMKLRKKYRLFNFPFHVDIYLVNNVYGSKPFIIYIFPFYFL